MKKQINIRALFIFLILLSVSPFLRAQTFNNPVPVPYLMSGNSFSINIGTALHNFDPNGTIDSVNLNIPIDAYCYNQAGNTGMTYLGPTLIFTKGAALDFDIANNLPPSVNTTVHWHGLNIPAKMDGGPHQVILNGGNWTPGFTVIDPVQTIWYHTHLMDATTDQVIRGLAGMIIVEDTNDPLLPQLPHDYGKNDFPIVIQEKNFILDRTTSPPSVTAIKAGEKPGKGPYTLVNGVVGGVLRVPQEMVRLRVLNGSPRKMFHIGLSNQLKSPSSFETMWMIATGGGYVDVPRPTDSTLMSIGDRREFIVDFSGFSNGDTIYMSNLAVPKDANYGPTPGNALMAFVVDNTIIPSNPITTMPSTLESYALDPGPVFKERTKELVGKGGSGKLWTIDGTPMDMEVINDTVLVNTKERWIIHNTTQQAHPFHIHKVQFQIVEYYGLLGSSDTTGVYKYPNLPDELFGYKDVQLIRAGATLIFEARFDSFPSPLHYSEGFMYHCHILTHEDTSMMHQFVVVDSVDFPTGISLVREQETIFVYPNPAESKLYLKGSFSGRGTLRFYNTLGKIIRREDLQLVDGSTIDVQDLPRGLVFVELISGEDRFLQKLILR